MSEMCCSVRMVRHLPVMGVGVKRPCVKSASSTLKSMLTAANGGTVSVSFSPDGKTLATNGHRTRTVRIWDLANGTLQSEIIAESGGIRSMSFSPDGATVASGGDDGKVRLWDVATRVITEIPRSQVLQMMSRMSSFQSGWCRHLPAVE